MDKFRRAVEAKDVEGIVAALAEDVVFQSPIVFREYTGRDVVGVILWPSRRCSRTFVTWRSSAATGRRRSSSRRAFGGREIDESISAR